MVWLKDADRRTVDEGVPVFRPQIQVVAAASRISEIRSTKLRRHLQKMTQVEERMPDSRRQKPPVFNEKNWEHRT